MEYTLVLVLHLFCAIIFIGFVFADVVVLPAMKKVLSQSEHEKVMAAISSRARMIFPLSVLTLVLSGGYMITKYVNSEVGFISTSLQQLLWLKVLIALVIVAGIVYSLFCKITKKASHPMMKHFHKFVLLMGIIIIFLAKFMFVV